MAQTDNPFLDGVAKAFTDAAGMAQSVRTEIDTFMRQRLERLERGGRGRHQWLGHRRRRRSRDAAVGVDGLTRRRG